MVLVETERRLQHESFKAAFDTFLAKQQELKEAGFFDPFSVETHEKLGAAIEESDWFGELYAEATRRYLKPLSDNKLSRVRNRFSGAIWENMAYHFLAARQPDDQVVLSPEQTFELFRLVLEEKGEDYQIVQHPFGTMGIKGWGVPDGVVYDLETQRNLFICEFTCYGRQQYFDRKFANFISGKNYQKKLYAGTELLFIVPDNKRVERFLKFIKSEIVPAPITHTQLREFMRGVVGEYKKDGGVTLLELQESARDPLRQTEIATDPRKFF